MASEGGGTRLLFGLGLIGCGVVGAVAWAFGYWGLLTGTFLTALWLTILNIRAATVPLRSAHPAPPDPDAGQAMLLRVLLDSAPTPLLAIEAGAVRALNRAARGLFATDDRVLPPPPALDGRGATHLRHEGRHWRIDRVEVPGMDRSVVALIDIEQEERTAEARATAEMIHVLGHELLNGLAPIVSLAESGLAAVASPDHRALLPEILGTLARRAEGLQRFTEGYRALARLPEPMLHPVAIAALVDDLARLFAGRWPGIALVRDLTDLPPVMLDRDQINQALWAVLQNAAEAAATGADAAMVTIAATCPADGRLRIAIGDSGTGVPPEDASRIFRPFHSGKPHGTGIGLSLARQIAHAHGGTLTLHPHPPTIFRFEFPATATMVAIPVRRP